MKLYLAFLLLTLPMYDFHKTKYFLGCRKIPPMKGFSLQKFVGRWYKIAKSDPAIEANLKCHVADNNYINSTFMNVTASLKTVWTNADIKAPALMKQKYPNIPGVFSIVDGASHDNFTVVDTDYRTYLVTHYCLGGSIYTEYEEAGVFNRKPVMDQKTFDKAKNKLQSNGFYTKLFTAIDQIDC